ncbi:hypothetical protein ACFFNY_30160 [Paenibacillus hodogayensis]|uniref:Transposase n=1 Tax=Paenibacillus hodogayensis TaxID=279208 RepID=A0ABV5W5L8_9BACL
MHQLDKDSTIYNFTLIKKVRHHPLALLLYGLLPLPFALLLILTGSPYGLLPMSGAIVLLPFLYSSLTRLNMRLSNMEQRNDWTYQWKFPWLGLLPYQHTPFGIVIRLHHQLFWIGLALIGCLYPWLGYSHWLAMAGIHLWYMAPRYWIFWRLRQSRKPGLLKITAQDTSFYTQ